MTFVIGHKNPDTDSICSAIGYAAFKRADTGEEYEARRAGELNPETQFVLDHFGLQAPELLESAAGQELILVDHNEKEQAVDGLTEGHINEILDHHKVGDIQTPDPIYFLIRPVGCTGTIVYDHFKKAGLVPEKDVAGALCSAILSDTLAFRSPTCTPADKEAAEALAKLAGIEDIQEYAKAMLKAGSNMGDKTDEEIFNLDYKKFTAGSTTYGVGQVTSVDADELKVLKERMTGYMNNNLEKQGVDMLFFMLTDVLDESSELICAGEGAEKAASEAFTSAEADRMYLKGVVSRKKQIIPQLTEVLPR
ncbi:MAG: manganese-dependent inorganic pyrophosphatase [Clostridia bacterium]|nr:manganese-dependent inorganic pyrophosphatase [Clostridia bacterium]